MGLGQVGHTVGGALGAEDAVGALLHILKGLVGYVAFGQVGLGGLYDAALHKGYLAVGAVAGVGRQGDGGGGAFGHKVHPHALHHLALDIAVEILVLHNHLLEVVLVGFSAVFHGDACGFSVFGAGVDHYAVFLAGLKSGHCLAHAAFFGAGHVQDGYAVAVVFIEDLGLAVLLPDGEIAAVESGILQRAAGAPVGLVGLSLGGIDHIGGLGVGMDGHLAIGNVQSIHQLLAGLGGLVQVHLVEILPGSGQGPGGVAAVCVPVVDLGGLVGVLGLAVLVVPGNEDLALAVGELVAVLGNDVVAGGDVAGEVAHAVGHAVDLMAHQVLLGQLVGEELLHHGVDVVVVLPRHHGSAAAVTAPVNRAAGVNVLLVVVHELMDAVGNSAAGAVYPHTKAVEIGRVLVGKQFGAVAHHVADEFQLVPAVALPAVHIHKVEVGDLGEHLVQAAVKAAAEHIHIAADVFGLVHPGPAVDAGHQQVVEHLGLRVGLLVVEVDAKIGIDLVGLGNGNVHILGAAGTLVDVLVIGMAGVVSFVGITLEDQLLAKAVHIVGQALHVVGHLQEGLLHAAGEVVAHMEEAAGRLVAAGNNAVGDLFHRVGAVLPVDDVIAVGILGDGYAAVEVFLLRLGGERQNLFVVQAAVEEQVVPEAGRHNAVAQIKAAVDKAVAVHKHVVEGAGRQLAVADNGNSHRKLGGLGHIRNLLVQILDAPLAYRFGKIAGVQAGVLVGAARREEGLTGQADGMHQLAFRLIDVQDQHFQDLVVQHGELYVEGHAGLGLIGYHMIHRVVLALLGELGGGGQIHGVDGGIVVAHLSALHGLAIQLILGHTGEVLVQLHGEAVVFQRDGLALAFLGFHGANLAENHFFDYDIAQIAVEHQAHLAGDDLCFFNVVGVGELVVHPQGEGVVHKAVLDLVVLQACAGQQGVAIQRELGVGAVAVQKAPAGNAADDAVHRYALPAAVRLVHPEQAADAVVFLVALPVVVQKFKGEFDFAVDGQGGQLVYQHIAAFHQHAAAVLGHFKGAAALQLGPHVDALVGGPDIFLLHIGVIFHHPQGRSAAHGKSDLQPEALLLGGNVFFFQGEGTAVQSVVGAGDQLCLTVLHRGDRVAVAELDLRSHIFFAPILFVDLHNALVQRGGDDLGSLDVFQRDLLAAAPDTETVAACIQAYRAVEGGELFLLAVTGEIHGDGAADGFHADVIGFVVLKLHTQQVADAGIALAAVLAAGALQPGAAGNGKALVVFAVGHAGSGSHRDKVGLGGLGEGDVVFQRAVEIFGRVAVKYHPALVAGILHDLAIVDHHAGAVGVGGDPAVLDLHILVIALALQHPAASAHQFFLPNEVEGIRVAAGKLHCQGDLLLFGLALQVIGGEVQRVVHHAVMAARGQLGAAVMDRGHAVAFLQHQGNVHRVLAPLGGRYTQLVLPQIGFGDFGADNIFHLHGLGAAPDAEAVTRGAHIGLHFKGSLLLQLFPLLGRVEGDDVVLGDKFQMICLTENKVALVAAHPVVMLGAALLAGMLQMAGVVDVQALAVSAALEHRENAKAVKACLVGSVRHIGLQEGNVHFQRAVLPKLGTAVIQDDAFLAAVGNELGVVENKAVFQGSDPALLELDILASAPLLQLPGACIHRQRLLFGLLGWLFCRLLSRLLSRLPRSPLGRLLGRLFRGFIGGNCFLHGLLSGFLGHRRRHRAQAHGTGQRKRQNPLQNVLSHNNSSLLLG